jgi:HAD superfamily phosphoserine phosphatase-like hydrolase
MAGKNEEIKVAVFDLNGTLYNKSSKDEFYKFICRKKPQKLGTIFQMGYYQVLQKLHRINQTEFKENFFNYLDNIPPAQVVAYATEFWRKEYPANFNRELLQRLERLKTQGVRIFCATGALELYVQPLFELYEVDGLAGTRVKYTGQTYRVEGEACKGQEKLRRIAAHYRGKPHRIVEAYSDSREAILEKAEQAFLIRDGKMCKLNG